MIRQNSSYRHKGTAWILSGPFTTVRPLIEVQLTEEQIRGKDVSAALMMIDELIINKLYAWFQPLNHQSLYNNILFWFRLLGFPQISRKFH